MRLVSAVLSVVLALAGTARAEPALWRLRGPQSTIYLFGTIHALKPGAPWRSAAMEAALARSQALWLEVANADDMAVARPLFLRYGTDRAHPLSTKLTAQERTRVDAAARVIGLPGEAALEPLQPWMAAVTLEVAPMLKAGYASDGGVEKSLKAQALAAGKPVEGLETLEGQLHFFADMSEPLQVQLLDSTLDDVKAGPAKLDAMVDSWLHGDTAALAKAGVDDLAHDEPQVYRTIIVERNRRWADTLAARLAQPGTVFVAVGALHLTGPDSVQAFLARKGIKAERIG